jgi:hypothetical protein
MFVRSRISKFFYNEAHAAHSGIYRTMEKIVIAEQEIPYYLLYGKRKRGLPWKKKSLEPVLFSVVLSDVDVNLPEVNRKRGWPAKATNDDELVVMNMPEELPQREWRYPRRCPLCLVFSYLVMLFCFQEGNALKIESRGSVTFKQESNVGFSESDWTIVIHPPTGKMTSFGAKLEGLLNKQVKLAEPTLDAASLFDRMGAFINARAQRSLQRLGKARKRLAETLRVVKTGRNKRGIFYCVRQGFEWLFGVATSSDLVKIIDRVDGLTKNQEDVVNELMTVTRLTRTRVDDELNADVENEKKKVLEFSMFLFLLFCCFIL